MIRSMGGWLLGESSWVGLMLWINTDALRSGDLTDEKVKKEYERGYQILLDFYHKHL